MKSINHIASFIIFSFFFISCGEDNSNIGQTEITKWKFDKKGAVSITYDDGNIHQFKRAMPIMDRLGLPGTFYIVTGEIPGSQYPSKFIGRPVAEIIKETRTVPTNKENFFERASAVGHLGYAGTLGFHAQAGQLYESGKIEEAYQVIDEAYSKVRAGKFSKGKDISWEAAQSSENTWDDFKKYAANGHEFGSHTISHPRLAVLDEANLLYELEKSKEDIVNHMGPEHIFSAECPFGTTDERVMEYSYKLFPSLRNRMPHPFLEEIHRGDNQLPGTSDKEYVQWQRGPLSDVPMEVMKSWVDTVSTQDNIWLVLVFHGIDDIGWEPRTTKDIETYFEYIKQQEKEVWIATFKDVTQYMRERKNAEVKNSENGNKVIINLTHTLDPDLYDEDLTLKTYVSNEWDAVQIEQDGERQNVQTNTDEAGRFILYQAVPNAGPIEISGGN